MASTIRSKYSLYTSITGRRSEALQVVDTLKAALRRAKDSERGDIAQDIGSVYAGLNDRGEAMNWLERAANWRARLLYLQIDPTFRSLHAEPRFRALAKRIGLGDDK